MSFPLEQALTVRITAHGTAAVLFLHDLAEVRQQAIARCHVGSESAAQKVRSHVSVNLGDGIAALGASPLPLLRWLVQRTERLARAQAFAGRLPAGSGRAVAP